MRSAIRTLAARSLIRSRRTPVNGIMAAKEMPVEAGAASAFDLGYCDCEWRARLRQASCRIVARFKTLTPLPLLAAKDLPLAKDTRALRGRTGFLPGRQAKSRKIRLPDAGREIAVKTGRAKRLRILSHDLDAPADAIAGLCKRRRQIELLLPVLKQTLRLRHFTGGSQNAVRIQAAVALIAHLLLRLLPAIAKEENTAFELARLVRANPMHRTNAAGLKGIQCKTPIAQGQYELSLCDI